MISCSRRFEFDAAHRLVGHEGACRNLHGHRYVVEFDVSAAGLDELGRVIDFGDLKRNLGRYLDEVYDHAAILNEADARLIALCLEEGWKLHVMACNPTSENIARELFDSASRLLPSTTRVEAVRVFETPNCWSECRRDGTAGRA
jgi:6-pyruvoyltetrahydropterin/6-carboxytetrahydropterin synthase